jgi:hypothetical protein
MEAATIVRAAGAAVLGVAALYLSILNWIILVRRFTRPRAPSWIPLIGGLLGAGALLLEPSGRLAPWWWAAFLVDGGWLPGLLSTALAHWLRGRPRGRS